MWSQKLLRYLSPYKRAVDSSAGQARSFVQRTAALGDTRRKSAATMRAALLINWPQNVITPEIY